MQACAAGSVVACCTLERVILPGCVGSCAEGGGGSARYPKHVSRQPQPSTRPNVTNVEQAVYRAAEVCVKNTAMQERCFDPRDGWAGKDRRAKGGVFVPSRTGLPAHGNLFPTI